MKLKSILSIGFLVLMMSVNLKAQETVNGENKWIFKTRMIMTGSSDQSDPDGYMVYSAITFEPSISRKLSGVFSLELNLRTESHEVDFSENAEKGNETALGSIELLPVNLVFQAFLPTQSKFHPYAGAGMNLTVCWEKSGALNSRDLTPTFGPAVQLGTDIHFSSNMLFNVNVGWNSSRTELKDKELKIAELKMDPISLGVGLGFKFGR